MQSAMALKHMSKLTAAYSTKDTSKMNTMASYILQNGDQGNKMPCYDEALKRVAPTEQKRKILMVGEVTRDMCKKRSHCRVSIFVKAFRRRFVSRNMF